MKRRLLLAVAAIMLGGIGCRLRPADPNQPAADALRDLTTPAWESHPAGAD